MDKKKKELCALVSLLLRPLAMCSIDLRPFVSHLKSFPLRFVKEKKEKEESGKKKIKT